MPEFLNLDFHFNKEQFKFPHGAAAEDIAKAGVDYYQPRQILVGFSGGKDSLATTHFIMTMFPNAKVLHVNTGIGIEKTREYVRETCERMQWPLIEIRSKEDCGQDYDIFVKRWGFPGPGGHGVMYNRLKERAIKSVVQSFKQKYKDRIILATGLRYTESARRSRYKDTLVRRVGSLVWMNPIYYWTASFRDRYIESFKLPINPVSQMLGMSGECLCGAFAHKGEKELVRLVCPRTAERIDRLEAEVRALGYNWGWEDRPPKNARDIVPRKNEVGPFCVGCEKVD